MKFTLAQRRSVDPVSGIDHNITILSGGSDAADAHAKAAPAQARSLRDD